MLDSDILHYVIHNSTAMEKLKAATQTGNISTYITQVQLDEIAKNPNTHVKTQILRAIQEIPIVRVPTSAVSVATDQISKHGFIGSKVGDTARVGDDNDMRLLERCKKSGSKNPVKNNADLLIFYTAYKENMDYVITENIRDFKKCIEVFKSVKSTKLAVINANQLLNLIT
jgi:hypothetical protein